VNALLALLALVSIGGCTAAAPIPAVPLPADTAGRVSVPISRTVTLTGVLTLPAGDARAPAVVLMHGCSGATPNTARWARVLRDWGYASLNLDSFGGRSLTSVCENGALRSDERVADAYAALRFLASHPRVDPARIALEGFSHGGGVVVLAGTQWIARGYTGGGAPSFRMFVAFYPRCDGRYPGTLAGPLRVHIGAIDDWTPAGPCEAMVDSLRRGGADARIVVYERARHAFDVVGLPPDRWLANVMAPHGRRGAHIGYNEEAARRAQDNVRRELAESMGT
jgi:dienelactone hydrolase